MEGAESIFVTALSRMMNHRAVLLLTVALMQLNIIVAAQSETCGALAGDRLCSVVDGMGQGYMQCYDSSASSPYNPWSPYNVVSVDWYGAMGDGQTDDTQAFMDAWGDACALDSAVFIIPEGKTYLVNPIDFKGPCGSSITVELAGTLVAPADPHTWNKSDSNAWLHFTHLNDLTVEGGGLIDGQGQQWWDSSCKINKTKKCHDAPIALRFSMVHNLKVRNLQSLNSPQVHLNFVHCYGVQAANLQISAPEHSPNTDGIHISGTQNVLIKDTCISTGDDCVSIVSGSSDIRMKNITCGPGHGISIGSLGRNNAEEYVSLVVVDGATITDTTNGIRIKTWQGGVGSAIGLRFENIQMNNVSYPIIIDQHYCDSAHSCPANETSAIQVSRVFYRNIWGTSATHQAIKLECSDLAPCKNLVLQDINLTPASGFGNCTSLCHCAQGFAHGTIIPAVDCLTFSEPQKALHSTA